MGGSHVGESFYSAVTFRSTLQEHTSHSCGAFRKPPGSGVKGTITRQERIRSSIGCAARPYGLGDPRGLQYRVTIAPCTLRRASRGTCDERRGSGARARSDAPVRSCSGGLGSRPALFRRTESAVRPGSPKIGVVATAGPWHQQDLLVIHVPRHQDRTGDSADSGEPPHGSSRAPPQCHSPPGVGMGPPAASWRLRRRRLRPVIGPRIDHFLARWSARHSGPAGSDSGSLPTRRIRISAGDVRVFDSGGDGPCVVLTPDGPNVIEHYAQLVRILAAAMRVVCFDYPGFGHSVPSPRYTHSLDEGACVVLDLLDALAIDQTTLAFSCANGFYALRTAQVAPHRIRRVVLAQTPSMEAMHAWKRRVIPWPLGIPGFGQAAMWFARKRSAQGWYSRALPRGADRRPFRETAHRAFDQGACWCLASITQGLARANVHVLRGVAVPCTLIWGTEDRSHRHTDPGSLRELVPQTEIRRFANCGHFPDLERPDRFAELLLARTAV